MRLIDVDNLTLSCAGLAKLSPYDFESITKFYYDQIQAARPVEAIPIDFIETLKADPANAGDKIRVLNWLSEEWEKAAGRKAEIDPEEQCTKSALLKPCPFCGGEAEVRIIYDELKTKDVPRFNYVRCVRCFSQTAEYSYKNSDRTGIDPRKACIKAWNRRVDG